MVFQEFTGCFKEEQCICKKFKEKFEIRAYVSRVFQGSFQCISKKFQRGFKEVSMVFQESLKRGSRDIEGCFKEEQGIWKKFEWKFQICINGLCLKVVSKKLEGCYIWCFKGVFQRDWKEISCFWGCKKAVLFLTGFSKSLQEVLRKF